MIDGQRAQVSVRTIGRHDRDARVRRLLCLSRYFPPQVNGSAIMMGNLLRTFPRQDVHVISGQPGRVVVDPASRLDVAGNVVELPRLFGRAGSRLTLLLYPFVVAAAMRLHRERPFGAVLACYPSAADLEFGYRIHKLLRIPLHVYMHDMWADNQRGRWWPGLATRIERRILREAETVFAITPDAAEHFRRLYGVAPAILEHSVDWSTVRQPDEFVVWRAAAGQPARITFSGAIYPLMNQDALVRINDAVQALPHAELSCCTQIVKPAAAYGLHGDRISMCSLDRRGAREHLRRSAIVSVPLAFDTWAKREVGTVFPTKVLDYLTCGRPILVHAPGDSFLARDARAKGWGHVVDEPSVAAVKGAIETILADEGLQRRLVERAWVEARRRDSRDVSRTLRSAVGLG